MALGTAREPKSSRVNSMRRPKMIRITGLAVPSCPGADRRLSPQIRTIRPDMPNVAASMPSVRCVPRMATTAAPATKPRIWLAR